MTAALHRVDPPSAPVRDGRAVIGAGAISSRSRAAAGLPNQRNDGWGMPRWAQAEDCTGGPRPRIEKVLKTGTKLPLP